MTFISGAIWLCGGLAVVLSPVGAAAETLIGRASVVDGDTIEIYGRRIRFHGVDAPESSRSCKDSSGADYRCGQAAAIALDDFLALARPTRCELTGERHRDRWIGTCFTAKGENISAWLVRSGHALDWPRYSAGKYGIEPQLASEMRAGLWAGGFLEPWNWRRSKPAVP